LAVKSETPAMQAGLTKQRLTFRDIFTSIPTFLRLARAVCVFNLLTKSTGGDNFAISIARYNTGLRKHRFRYWIIQRKVAMKVFYGSTRH
jgi:hypothetical protein